VAVKIRGYADRTGWAEDNLLLSERRAQNVLNAIGRYGVPCERLNDYKGMGEEDTPGQADNRPFSRRVEVIVEGTLPADDAVAACKNSPPPSPAPPRCVTPR
jgi:outer membrane protein OmpA-like peptidoglycan-associated protein